jgi:hypothetical protein
MGNDAGHDRRSMTVDNKVVVRYRNGEMLKGFTHDFGPQKEFFHVIEKVTGTRTKVVNTGALKAVFFVKTFDGDRTRVERPDWDRLRTTPGLKLRVTFSDGEVIYGTSSVYDRRRRGFFVRPAHHDTNNERLYVPNMSAAKVDTWF